MRLVVAMFLVADLFARSFRVACERIRVCARPPAGFTASPLAAQQVSMVRPQRSEDDLDTCEQWAKSRSHGQPTGSPTWP